MQGQVADASRTSVAEFSTTQWSVVLKAGGHDSVLAASALDALCRKYWYPIYAFVRRRGCMPHDAEDLTQAFFARLLEKEMLKKVSREKGKFRSFLLASLTNFLNNDWDKRQRLKRGGGRSVVSLDELRAEERYLHEPVDSVTPETLFERRWAWTLVEEVFLRLKQEYVLSGKEALFLKLEPALTREFTSESMAQCAAELKINENALKVALHRLRRRFGQLLRSEIARTVADPDEIEDEIRHLFMAISR